MKNDISCAVIRDLFSIYYDKLASDKTKTVVKEHLENCSYCQKEYATFEEINNNPRDENYIIKNFKIKTICYSILLFIMSTICIFFSITAYKLPIGYTKLTIVDLLFLIPINFAIYFLPNLALLISWIWTQISPKHNTPKIMMTIFIIIILLLIINLLFSCVSLYNFYGRFI
ncbi:MAG: zf-HC2 domain-containing protein [Clostridiales bacterium]|nr:zf-HC2 domain-containing protein [Clostridiales bacterium]